MSLVQRSLLFTVLSCVVVSGCTDTTNADNDNTASANGGKDAGKDAGKSGKDAGKDSGKQEPAGDDDDDDDDDTGEVDSGTPGTHDSGSPSEDAGAGDDDDDTGESDAGAKTDSGGGKPSGATIAGTATKSKCSSYGDKKGDQCGTWFCGVTEADILAALPAPDICGATSADDAASLACSNIVPVTVGDCAVMIKTDAANLTLSDDELRPKILECAKKNSEVAKMSDDCLDCFMDVAQCASDNCLVDCLLEDGKGPNCDACRVKNNCDQKAFTCTGLPSPF